MGFGLKDVAVADTGNTVEAIIEKDLFHDKEFLVHPIGDREPDKRVLVA